MNKFAQHTNLNNKFQVNSKISSQRKSTIVLKIIRINVSPYYGRT